MVDVVAIAELVDVAIVVVDVGVEVATSVGFGNVFVVVLGSAVAVDVGDIVVVAVGVPSVAVVVDVVVVVLWAVGVVVTADAVFPSGVNVCVVEPIVVDGSVVSEEICLVVVATLLVV